MERDIVRVQQCERFSRRIDGILRKKEVITSKELLQDLKGVLTSSADLKKEADKLEMKKIPNYVILGDVTVTEEEKRFLDIHYKCRETQKLRKVELETEVSRLQSKHRYEKISQGDDMENLSDTELEETLKELEAEKEMDRLENRVLKEHDIDFRRV